MCIAALAYPLNPNRILETFLVLVLLYHPTASLWCCNEKNPARGAGLNKTCHLILVGAWLLTLLLQADGAGRHNGGNGVFVYHLCHRCVA